MNIKPKFVYYDTRRKQSVGLIMYTHENDVDTQVLEVSMLDNGEPIELSADYTYSAAIVNRDTKALINDNISCELNDSGNVLIPIDNFHMLGAQDLLIELTITDSAGDQVLVTPFPLWIHVNASILDDAQVTPESQGTVPELLEEAKEALENAVDYESLENKPQINGHELVGNKTGDDLGLQKKLTAGTNITITNDGTISASGGVTSYSDLTDKPQINSVELSGNKTLDNLGVQAKIDNSHKLSSDFIDDTNNTNKFVTAQEKATWNEKEDASNKVTSISASSTNTEYPSAKCVYDAISASSGTVITSATVNNNGTITFTDSDGSTFTTTGSSVIGADGFSPVATVTQTASGATVSITDKNGTTTANISNGAPGQDYVLTAQDKDDIADIVLAEFTGSIVNGELNTR